MRSGLVIAGLLAGCVCAPAICAPTVGGQVAPPKSFAPAAAVNLENKRPVALLAFEIVAPARNGAPERIVGKLAAPLAAGAAVRLPLSGEAGCEFEARWAFDDFKDAGVVDLCNDGRIILVD
ncbi:hypothetical protein WOC76_16235 [Methylocystis sp. IM3]|uniref:hypothetical protein n=1 Tax=unclassified Methylocystis TaxID=2625913 RepID=UPI000FB4355C|nr:MAG: hypothetical protein EKK29_19605 [Hyphomicrobiales bacterium]